MQITGAVGYKKAEVTAGGIDLREVNPQTLESKLQAGLFFAGEMEYRALKRREIEDAHWRAVLARTYGAPPPLEEPPLLTR